MCLCSRSWSYWWCGVDVVVVVGVVDIVLCVLVVDVVFVVKWWWCCWWYTLLCIVQRWVMVGRPEAIARARVDLRKRCCCKNVRVLYRGGTGYGVLVDNDHLVGLQEGRRVRRSLEKCLFDLHVKSHLCRFSRNR